VVDAMPRVTKRKVQHFSHWPSAGTRVMVWWTSERAVCAPEPGEVINGPLMDPEHGYYVIVRLDRPGAPPLTVDRLKQLTRPTKEGK
jgi:hypothetical protein